MAPLAAVNADLTIGVGVSGSEVIAKREPEPGATDANGGSAGSSDPAAGLKR